MEASKAKAELEALAVELNPTIGYYDPLNLADASFWQEGQDAAIGWLRHAEIKHGRVAMFAFVGFIAGSNKLHFPWALTTGGVTFEDIANVGGPAAQWDALPTAAKLQILGAIGLLEFFGEGGNDSLKNAGAAHYMRGGKPGYYPPLKAANVPHPVPFNLFDPFGVSQNMSAEKKATGMVKEINNGRLAMIGIFGFLAESKLPGSVPLLNGLITPYAGEPMAPFSAVDSALPMVPEMLKFPFL